MGKEFNMYGSKFSYKKIEKNHYLFTKMTEVNVRAKNLEEAKKKLRKIIKKKIII